MTPKIPVSVLVVVYTPALEVLLLERARFPGYWQSVTGSIDREDEPLEAAARRELAEETGLAPAPGALRAWDMANTFEIYAQWRHRFVAGTTHNVEHVFGCCVPTAGPVSLAPDEHSASMWLPCHEAAAKCFSWSNRDAILQLPRRAARASPAC